VPYLDIKMVDMALSLPDNAKMGTDIYSGTYRSAGIKRILVDIGRKLLPEGFDDRPKRGFAMPFDAWMRGSLSSVVDDTLSQKSVINRGWINSRNAIKVRDKFYNKEVGWSHPWLLMMIELWGREVFDPTVDNWENKNA
jgi:asparagine synthase (glutamine-hydrolysing)